MAGEGIGDGSCVSYTRTRGSRSTLNSSRSMDSMAARAFGSPDSARFRTANPFSAVPLFNPTVSAARSLASPDTSANFGVTDFLPGAVLACSR